MTMLSTIRESTQPYTTKSAIKWRSNLNRNGTVFMEDVDKHLTGIKYQSRGNGKHKRSWRRKFVKNKCVQPVFCLPELECSITRNVCFIRRTLNCLHGVMQESKDLKLKRAFDECPFTLQRSKICSSSACDAMASELRYHQIWWNKYILRRQPEKSPVSQTVSVETLLRILQGQRK